MPSTGVDLLLANNQLSTLYRVFSRPNDGDDGWVVDRYHI